MTWLRFRQPVLLISILMLLCLCSTLWIVSLEWMLPWRQLWAPADSLPLTELMVQQQTLPRMAMALLAGGALALASLLMQQMTRNPLASDSTLAVSGGAQTALLAAGVFLPTISAWGSGVVAAGGAAAALAMVLLLSAHRHWQPLSVVLAGMVTGLYLGAVSGVITLFYSEEMRGMLLWGSGSLLQEGWHDSRLLLYCILAATALIAVLRKPLHIMLLDDQQAAALGIPVAAIRITLLTAAALLSAAVVALVGMMGFVGLAAAGMVGALGIRTITARLCWAFVLGGMLLLLTDNVLVLLQHHYGIALPTGAVSAVIGAPLLLWLMTRLPAEGQLAGTDHSDHCGPTSRLLPLLPLVAVLVLVLALCVGRDHQGWYASLDPQILNLRYPRVLTAAAAGLMLACCGVLLQRMTRNPMASPELLGISSAAALGTMASVLLAGVAIGSGLFWLSGLLSALAALGLMLALNRRNGLQPEKILLTGMALAAFADAALRVWAASGDFRVQLLLAWVSGSTYQATAGRSLAMLLAALLLLTLCLPLQRWLLWLGLGGSSAQAAGVHVPHARRMLVLLAAVLTALATLSVGPLSFVGLLAPHLARMLGARTPCQQLLTAALLGLTVMTAADWLGRQWLFPYEIPAGLMATLLGGAYFLWMMRRL